MEKTRKAREAKTKAEAETVERSMVWAEVKAKNKEEIARVNSETREGGVPPGCVLQFIINFFVRT